MTAAKLPTLFVLMQQGLADGKSLVVGLLGTGEAYCGTDPLAPSSDGAAANATSAGGAGGAGDGGGGGGGSVDGLPPAPATILRNVITSVLFPDFAEEGTSLKGSDCGGSDLANLTSEHKGSGGSGGSDEAEMQYWLARAEALMLPANPLDSIMHALQQQGVPAVELSGRQEVAAQRNAARARFQSAQALVAVISDAASTGVSLHAPNPQPGSMVRPRLHVTLELNWSADRQIQQLGRTHRTGQACPPEHVLLVTDICGEQRFVSTVARRLQSLGALSGDGSGRAGCAAAASGVEDAGSGGISSKGAGTLQGCGRGWGWGWGLGVEQEGAIERHGEGRWGDVLESLETSYASSALLQMYLMLHFRVSGGTDADLTEVQQARSALRTYRCKRVVILEEGRKAPHKPEDDEDQVQEQGCSVCYDTDEVPTVHCATHAEAEQKRDELCARLRHIAQSLLPDYTGEGAAIPAGGGVTAHVGSFDDDDASGGGDGVGDGVGGDRNGSGGTVSSEDRAVADDERRSSLVPLPRTKAMSVTLFLNRLLGLGLAQQEELLHLFKYLCRVVQRRAQREGRLEDSVREVPGRMVLRNAQLVGVASAAVNHPASPPSSSETTQCGSAVTAAAGAKVMVAVEHLNGSRTGAGEHDVGFLAFGAAQGVGAADGSTAATVAAAPGRLLLLELRAAPAHLVSFASVLALVRHAQSAAVETSWTTAAVPTDGFYVPKTAAADKAGPIVCARRIAAPHQPNDGDDSSGDDEPMFTRIRPDGAPLSPVDATTLREEYQPVALSDASTAWLRAALAGVAEDDGHEDEPVFLLCGSLLPCLPQLRRLLGSGGAPGGGAGAVCAVRRATLLSGQVAVGLLVPRDKVAAVLQEAPAALQRLQQEETAAATTVAADGATLSSAGGTEIEGQQRWFSELQRALVSQRALQAALPAHDDHEEWRRCWEMLKQHESCDLDGDELHQARQKQADTRSFQLEIQRRKKIEAREQAAGYGLDSPSSRLGDSVGAPHDGLVAASARHWHEGALATTRLATPGFGSAGTGVGSAAPSTNKRRPAFMPTARTVRTSAAEVHAAKQSKLHPLLQHAPDEKRKRSQEG